MDLWLFFGFSFSVYLDGASAYTTLARAKKKKMKKKKKMNSRMLNVAYWLSAGGIVVMGAKVLARTASSIRQTPSNRACRQTDFPQAHGKARMTSVKPPQRTMP
jgi:hypothetical protein